MIISIYLHNYKCLVLVKEIILAFHCGLLVIYLHLKKKIKERNMKRTMIFIIWNEQNFRFNFINNIISLRNDQVLLKKNQELHILWIKNIVDFNLIYYNDDREDSGYLGLVYSSRCVFFVQNCCRLQNIVWTVYLLNKPLQILKEYSIIQLVTCRVNETKFYLIILI